MSLVEDNRKKWDEAMRLYSGISDAHVTVGIHSDAKPYLRGQGDAANVAQIASFHEFGTSRMPQRAFFRPTLDGNRTVYNAMLAKVLSAILSGRMRLVQGLTLVGMKVQGDVRKAIVDLKLPPLAPSTIRRKIKKSMGTFRSYARKEGLRGQEAEADAQRRAQAYSGAGANPLVDTGHMMQSVTYRVVVGK